ncbi:hypothetical protein IL306_014232 [Fusarium sp. DS 682]|nr:hypothetical protein IL306_014232 [Fusarium sp. DS 682]
MAENKRRTPPPPPAPPLPPSPPKITPTGAESEESLTKAESVPKDCVLRARENSKTPDPWPYHYKPVYYFFYDALTFPAVLQQVLEASETPKLRDAKVTGFSVASCGPEYTALIAGEPNEEVRGKALQVCSPEDEYKLGWYQTGAYTLGPCLIQFMDGGEPKKVAGLAFMDTCDEQAWRAMRFDYKAWKLQMGTRLPRDWQRSSVQESPVEENP